MTTLFADDAADPAPPERRRPLLDRINWNIVFPYVLSVALAIGPAYHRFATLEANAVRQESETEKLRVEIRQLRENMTQLNERIAKLTMVITVTVPKARQHIQ
jgi:uncharacterized protein YlxW (UPF0749 family)